MKKLLWTLFALVILLIFIGISSCIQTGDEERPGMRVSADLILSKVWKITTFKDNGQNKTASFHNVFVEFQPNLIFRVTNECDVVEGEWALSSDSTLLVIRLPDSPEPLGQFEDEWVVTWYSDTEMHLIEQDDKGDEEFHLEVAPLQALSCQSCDDITQALTGSDWSVTLLTTQTNDATRDVRGSYFQFDHDGGIVLHHNDEELTGSWAIIDNCQTLVIQWAENQVYSESYENLENSWQLSQNDLDYMVFENEDNDGTLELTKGQISQCKEMESSVLNTSWFIERVLINMDDVSANFVGSGMTFLENNQLATDVPIGPAVLGDWMVSGECDQLTLHIQAGLLSELSRTWVISEIDNESMKLVYEEGSLRMELHLKKGKPYLTANCVDFIDFMILKTWSVKSYSENDQYDELKFAGYHFEFMENGDLKVINAEHEIIGSWYPIKNCGHLIMEVPQNSAVNDLNGKWEVESFSDNEIVMVYDKLNSKRRLKLIHN